ncbi:MAG: helix-turn-helix domain-containing protein [Nitrospirota bacterium]
MKITNPLDKILDNESKIKVLRFLFKTNAEWNGRQIAKEIGVSPATTHKALRGLNREGILSLRNMGKTYVYTLNQDNFTVANMLKPLFVSEDKLMNHILGIIRKEIAASTIKNSISSVALFGSVSARKDNAASDIDLIVIVRDIKTKVAAGFLFEEIDKRISKELGNTVSAYINTETELRVKYKKGVSIIRNIIRENHLIYGEPVERLL